MKPLEIIFFLLLSFIFKNFWAARMPSRHARFPTGFGPAALFRGVSFSQGQRL
jgi:hypothetical protein